ncbi:hypothetical protein ACJX0J_007706, partial [Zea mays]
VSYLGIIGKINLPTKYVELQFYLYILLGPFTHIQMPIGRESGSPNAIFWGMLILMNKGIVLNFAFTSYSFVACLGTLANIFCACATFYYGSTSFPIQFLLLRVGAFWGLKHVNFGQDRLKKV